MKTTIFKFVRLSKQGLKLFKYNDQSSNYDISGDHKSSFRKR